MNTPFSQTRINIYVDDPHLRTKIKIAAAHQGVTISAYCLDAIRRRLVEEGHLPKSQTARAKVAARALDRWRERIGPVGVPVRELIEEGRR